MTPNQTTGTYGRGPEGWPYNPYAIEGFKIALPKCEFCGKPEDGTGWCCTERFKAQYQEKLNAARDLLERNGYKVTPPSGQH